MVPTITTSFLRAPGPVLLAALLLLSPSSAILRADEAPPSLKHCRMYFGCLPDLAKARGPLN